MTKNKDKQRLIRARAQDAGIPYTKARVDLLGPDAPGGEQKPVGLDSTTSPAPGATGAGMLDSELTSRRTPTKKVFEQELSRMMSSVRLAFLRLREQGFLCRMNYRSCMSEALGDLMEQAESKKGKARGVVYWHEQDQKGFREWGRLYLRFAGVGQHDTKQAGIRVVAALEQAGISGDWIRWNGDPDTAICLVSPEGPRNNPATTKLLLKLLPVREALSELERKGNPEALWLLPVTREALKVIEAFENYSYGGKAMFENLLDAFLDASRKLARRRSKTRLNKPLTLPDLGPGVAEATSPLNP